MYPRLSHINPKNIPDQMITPIAYLIRKDDSNIEPSDRVRIVQVWEDYLFLLRKANTARGKSVDRKSSVNWEVFYKYAIEPYKQLHSTMKEEQGKQKKGTFNVQGRTRYGVHFNCNFEN